MLLSLVGFLAVLYALTPFWILRGRAYLEKRLAALGSLEVSRLPHNQEGVGALGQQRSAGRRIFALGQTNEWVLAMRKHLGRQAIEDRFGAHRFDYLGNDGIDLPIWKAAHNAYVVNPSRGLFCPRARGCSCRCSLSES